MLARRFLYLIAIVIVLILAAGVAWTLFQRDIMRAALVPTVAFAPAPDRTALDYRSPSAWLARPDLPDDPSRWGAPGFEPTRDPQAEVFFIHPTTALNRDRWNVGTEDGEANYRLRLFVSSQASAFNGIGRVWAPRYRQATIGAFLTSSPDALQALDFAYRDVERAFDAFLAQVPPGRPIILAGHSQGALHLSRLLREHVAGTPVAARIAAAYVIGWPLSTTADLPALGLPACQAAGQPGCILSWMSFAEPADAGQLMEVYDGTTGYTGQPRRGTPALCSNPLTGAPGGTAPASANLGSLVPSEDLTTAEIVPGRVPARCDAMGLLLIGPEPAGYGNYVMPGNNYHVFDYALFWANTRADAAARVQAFQAR